MFQGLVGENAVEESEDAGISRAMESGFFRLEERIPLLLIHGILHMLGYDHETEEDWAQMTKEEDRLLNLFIAAQQPPVAVSTQLDRLDKKSSSSGSEVLSKKKKKSTK